MAERDLDHLTDQFKRKWGLAPRLARYLATAIVFSEEDTDARGRRLGLSDSSARTYQQEVIKGLRVGSFPSALTKAMKFINGDGLVPFGDGVELVQQALDIGAFDHAAALLAYTQPAATPEDDATLLTFESIIHLERGDFEEAARCATHAESMAKRDGNADRARFAYLQGINVTSRMYRDDIALELLLKLDEPDAAPARSAYLHPRVIGPTFRWWSGQPVASGDLQRMMRAIYGAKTDAATMAALATQGLNVVALGEAVAPRQSARPGRHLSSAEEAVRRELERARVSLFPAASAYANALNELNEFKEAVAAGREPEANRHCDVGRVLAKRIGALRLQRVFESYRKARVA